MSWVGGILLAALVLATVLFAAAIALQPGSRHKQSLLRASGGILAATGIAWVVTLEDAPVLLKLVMLGYVGGLVAMTWLPPRFGGPLLLIGAAALVAGLAWSLGHSAWVEFVESGWPGLLAYGRKGALTFVAFVAYHLALSAVARAMAKANSTRSLQATTGGIRGAGS